MVRARLDRVLVEKGLVATRSRARDLIARGLVSVGGVIATKAGQEIGQEADIAVAPGANVYVSRGAAKLGAAMAHFGFDVGDRIALDIGASTGGFTQVLLEGGARRVYAIDVGRDQLHPLLRENERVISMEGTDARALTREIIPDALDAIVADVSFISLIKVLAVPFALAAPQAWLVALIKPQFEAGRAAIAKGGIVRDEADRQRAVETVTTWVANQPGWSVAGVIDSPILGGSGNQEFLIGARKDG